jgi:hypothetical protein
MNPTMPAEWPLARPPIDPARYNAALEHDWTATLSRHLRHRGIGFSQSRLIEEIAGLDRFPKISIGDFLRASRNAGIDLQGGSMDLSELIALPLPMLCFLRVGSGAEVRMMLTQLILIGRKHVVVADDAFGQSTISIEELRNRFSGVGVVITGSSDDATDAGATELARYEREIETVDTFIDAAHCRALIDYCEGIAFNPSKVGQRRSAEAFGVVDTRIRNSWSTVLTDRNHPLIADIYARCAAREGMAADMIENVQCVRYRRGQRFRTHFDSSSQYPRLTTFLLYLNEGFVGGETVFPVLGRSIMPRAGRCLRFPSCDHSGRTLWPSEHGGLPLRSGVKYALNIWLRCPAPILSQHMHRGADVKADRQEGTACCRYTSVA